MNLTNRCALAFLGSFLVINAAVGQPDVQHELSASLVGKAMLLKSTCQNQQLSWDAQGALMGNCLQGPWTIHSLFYIQNVRLTGQSLEIRGIREVDSVIATGAVTRSKSRTGLAFPDLDRIVLSLQLPGPLNDMSSANALLAKVFASPSEREEELSLYQRPVPASAGTGKEGGSVGMLGPDRPIYKVVDRQEIQPPIAMHPEEPEYSDAARDARITGSVWLRVVVNEHGDAERIQVTRRLGFGLDEKSVAAVANWKFRPGQKAGHPVSVEISTEMSFHL